MSSPPQGRALALPIVWGRNRELSLPAEARAPSDEELMAKLRERDSNALDVLFSRYSRLVLGIALRILNDYSEAEEIVQEVFFYVYQKAALFDPARGSAKTWTIQIAFNRSLDRKAHLARRGFYSGTDIASLDDTLWGKTDLEKEIGAQLNREYLQRAFDDLTEMQHRTLELFYFGGLELREISDKLNEPLGNVRHHFYRGLERLRKSAFVQRLRTK
jgi:RNA polymerase sigma-70 factor, ECF subfamily